MSPRRAYATAKLLEQVNDQSPERDKSSDGWIGDEAHASRKSDHNPNNKGVVRAQDITHDPSGGFNSYTFAEMLRGKRDPRIKYVISNRKIFSGPAGPQPWVWRGYSGSNPHDMHVHISAGRDTESGSDASYYDDANPWDIGAVPFVPDPSAQPKDLPNLRQGAKGFYVEMVQTCLKLPAKDRDRDFGPNTKAAVQQFQRDHRLDPDGTVGPYTWRELLRPWAEEVELIERTPPVPLPIPEPNPEPTEEWQRDITATEFGGPGDEQPVAYSDVEPGWPDRPGVALPMRFSGTRPNVEVSANGRSIICQIVDVGPWYPSTRGPADPYWETGARPRAETDERTNGAGIDLTPAAADAVGVEGKALVDWRFV